MESGRICCDEFTSVDVFVALKISIGNPRVSRGREHFSVYGKNVMTHEDRQRGSQRERERERERETDRQTDRQTKRQRERARIREKRAGGGEEMGRAVGVKEGGEVEGGGDGGEFSFELHCYPF